jgi:hypothetical protein
MIFFKSIKQVFLVIFICLNSGIIKSFWCCYSSDGDTTKDTAYVAGLTPTLVVAIPGTTSQETHASAQPELPTNTPLSLDDAIRRAKEVHASAQPELRALSTRLYATLSDYIRYRESATAHRPTQHQLPPDHRKPLVNAPTKAQESATDHHPTQVLSTPATVALAMPSAKSTDHTAPLIKILPTTTTSLSPLASGDSQDVPEPTVIQRDNNFSSSDDYRRNPIRPQRYVPSAVPLPGSIELYTPLSSENDTKPVPGHDHETTHGATRGKTPTSLGTQHSTHLRDAAVFSDTDA